MSLGIRLFNRHPDFKPVAPRRLQYIYSAMKQRCYNPKHIHYESYNLRGILICDEWFNNSKSFYDWCMANGYESTLTLDRIDNNKGYSPDNCRWTDSKTQCRNKRNNVVTLEIARQIQAEPKRTNLDELCLKYRLARSTLKRIKYKQTWK